MATAARTTRSLSLDKSIVHEIERTKGTVSTSERVNELLRAGLAAEKRAALHEEVASFFGREQVQEDAEAEKEQHDAFHAAAVSSMIAEGD